MKTLKEGLIAAADWLEANPDRHIQGFLATDASGNGCHPTSPAAECFCAIGRVSHELKLGTTDNIDSSVYGEFDDLVQKAAPGLNIISDHVVAANDQDGRKRKMFCPLMEPASSRAIRLLRKIASKL